MLEIRVVFRKVLSKIVKFKILKDLVFLKGKGNCFVCICLRVILFLEGIEFDFYVK